MNSTICKRRNPRHLAAVVVLLAAGCAVGPNFKAPAPPGVSGYTTGAPRTTVATPGDPAGAAQRFERGADIPADWWRLFHSRQLDTLISAALTNNPGLKSAQAALRVAYEDMLAQRGAFFPSVSAGMAASRQRTASVLAPVPFATQFLFSLFTPQVAVSYSPDLFGLTRRTHESLEAQAQAARFQMIATWTTLSANVTVTAVQAASLREQVQATRRLIDLEKRSLAILRLRLQGGDASGLDVAAQESQLAQAQAGLPALVKQLRQTEHALAVLTGRFPDQPPIGALSLADLHL
ncbi:MAG: TolC family protein, partial [Steroidobacteraceae bacterium]